MLINEWKPQKTTDAKMEGKVVIVTGANSGVGFETAKRFVEGGAHVVMVCRNKQRGEAAKLEIEKAGPGPVDLVLADLSIMDDVRTLAQTLLDTYPEIHVLVNNAGLHSSTYTTTGEGIETCWAVNHLAPFLLTRLLQERMVQSAPATILMVSSQGHRFNGLDLNDLEWKKRYYRGLKAYGSSKVANLLVSWDLADELRGSGVNVIAVHPGSVESNIGSNNGKLWKAFKDNVVGKLMLRETRLAGDSLYYLVASPEMADVTGRFYNLTICEKPAPHALDRALGKTVWALSEHMSGLVVPAPLTESTGKKSAAKAKGRAKPN